MLGSDTIENEVQPEGIKALRELFSGRGSVEQVDFETLERTVPLYIEELTSLYKAWFSRTPSLSDEHIAEEIFQIQFRTSRAKNHYRCCLAAQISSVERTWEKAKEYHSSGNESGYRYELHLLSEIAGKTLPFLQRCFLFIAGRRVNFSGQGWVKLGLRSFEAYSGSKEFLRRNTNPRNVGTVALEPSSVFLLRHAIELRLMAMFGIISIGYSTGKTKKAAGSFLFGLIKRNQHEIRLPVKRSILEKIYGWTNVFIHTGREMWPWETEWAQYMLAPLFESVTRNGETDSYRQVKITRDLYSRVNSEVTEILEGEAKRACLVVALWNRIFPPNRQQNELVIERLPAEKAEALIVDDVNGLDD